MDDLFAVHRTEHPGVLRLVGELDLAADGQLVGAVRMLADAGITEIVFDVAQLSFVDSRGLSELLKTREIANISIRDPQPQMIRLLEMTGLDTIIPIVQN